MHHDVGSLCTHQPGTASKEKYLIHREPSNSKLLSLASQGEKILRKATENSSHAYSEQVAKQLEMLCTEMKCYSKLGLQTNTRGVSIFYLDI